MRKKVNIKGIVSDLIFYGCLVSMVVAVLAISGSGAKGPRVFGGYSAFVVLTGSMEDVIPRGSLVITKSVDAEELQIGDDITYMVSESTTVTHRIIDIEEEYLNTGERAFYTQGTMNSSPDRNPVAAVNVVGKVVFHNKTLGMVIGYGQENWPLLIFFIAVFLVFVKAVELIFRREEPVVEQEISKQTMKMSQSRERAADEDDTELEIIDL